MSDILKKNIVYEQLRSDIGSGKLPVGSKLPSGVELAGQYEVSHITIRAVLKKLAQEGYIVLIHGRGTFVHSNVSGGNHTAKILVLTHAESTFSDSTHYILPALERRCIENRAEVEILNVRFLHSGSLRSKVTQLKKNNYTAVVLTASYFLGQEREIQILRQLKLPVLIAHAKIGDDKRTGFSITQSDECLAWGDGLRHLIELGLKRTAILCPNLRDIRGYHVEELSAKMQNMGFAGGREMIQETLFSQAAVTASVKKILSMKQLPDAIFCFSDFYALYVYEALKDAGLKIPDDISVLGFCGYPGGELLSPPLSTVDLRYADIGSLLADLLLAPEKWYTPDTPQLFVTPHVLKRRGSTAAKTLSTMPRRRTAVC